MLKKVMIGCGVVALVAVIGLGILGWWGYQVMTGPMYKPGTLAAARTLTPPPQPESQSESQSRDTDTWLVERDIEIHHFARGDGRPVLFVHGGPGFPVREPMPWLDTLAETRTVHFYDQRGCGRSTRPFDRFTSKNTWTSMMQLEAALGLGTQIADIERIRQLLGEEKLTLVGHSFGAFQATLYASEFPDRVDKLVLLAPAGMLVMPGGTDLFEIVRERLPADQGAAFDELLDTYLDFGALFTHDEDELARMNLRLGNFILTAMGRPTLDLPEAGAHLDAGGWMVHAMYLSMGLHHDYTDALARITADTLVVHGEADITPDTAAVQYADLIANAELLRLPDTDHFFEGDTGELADRVTAFLGQGSRSSTATAP